jgi:bifunctional non-homologous end joining protein LigD
MPAPQALSAELVEEGHTIPIARVQAMHEGKRRARAATRTKPRAAKSGTAKPDPA